MSDYRSIDMPRLQTASQMLFTLAFATLVVIGRPRLWIIVFAVGLVTVRYGGRWYCGWACPINAGYRLIDVVYGRLGWHRKATPTILENRWTRWGIVLLTLAIAVGGRIVGIQIPVILLIILFGISVGLVYIEATFHCHICPFGTALSALGDGHTYGLEVTSAACTGCGQCQQACPTDTIETQSDETRQIQNRECLTCFSCAGVCPTEAISYNQLSPTE